MFIPILLLDLPVGQLFRDIGIAISVSVLISVIISITLIPTVASRILESSKEKEEKSFQLHLLIILQVS